MDFQHLMAHKSLNLQYHFRCLTPTRTRTSCYDWKSEQEKWSKWVQTLCTKWEWQFILIHFLYDHYNFRKYSYWLFSSFIFITILFFNLEFSSCFCLQDIFKDCALPPKINPKKTLQIVHSVPYMFHKVWVMLKSNIATLLISRYCDINILMSRRLDATH